VNHVFVETNFIIDVLRPFPAPAAATLLARVGADVTLHLPWVAVAEAKRTLVRVIGEDLGFTQTMERFAAAEFKAGNLSNTEKPVIDRLAKRATDVRVAEISAAVARVDALAARTELIEPTKAVVTRTLGLFAVRSLKAFDEMVLGAVLTKAQELHAAGERNLFFCNKNKKDFAPTNQPALEAEYRSCGLDYRDEFVVP